MAPGTGNLTRSSGGNRCCWTKGTGAAGWDGTDFSNTRSKMEDRLGVPAVAAGDPATHADVWAQHRGVHDCVQQLAMRLFNACTAVGERHLSRRETPGRGRSWVQDREPWLSGAGVGTECSPLTL